jgi:hypothetical protein
LKSQSTFSHHNVIKLNINKRKITGIPPIWKLKNILLNILSIKETLKGKPKTTRNEPNEGENTAY